ncbi:MULTISPECIES: MarR family transcriptional regulator [Microbacterium]|uniref:MarR family winged helix-turn-helix transcriptional regulator n=1 Tax=Microbacterium TaxID=33882 RepID=UPI00146ED6F4|nr:MULTISPECIES: MarR family transcriptional regulator [Microbacterium]
MSGVQLLDALLALTAVLQADQERELDRRGLTPSRTHLLWVLHHGGPATQAHLAHALDVTPRHITTLVDALEATGFARREPHPTDRRAVLVSLTERGAEVMRSMDDEHDAFGAALVEGLDDATVEASIRAVEHVRGRLEHLIAENERSLAERDEGR